MEGKMTVATYSNGALTNGVVALVRGVARRTPFFLYILVLYIAGKFFIPDPRATLVQWGEYHLSWVEILMVIAAMAALAEQPKVSHPGVDNTIEAILVTAVGGVQVLLFALGAAGVRPLAIFNNTEFVMLTLISMTQAVVAFWMCAHSSVVNATLNVTRA